MYVALFKQWGQGWWHMLVTPALGKLRREDWEFKGSLGYIGRAPVRKQGGAALAGPVGATHLLDGAQRVRVLLLSLLDLTKAAAALVLLRHSGL